ncbi:MAG: GGDEF domain-containing protein, partial [Burkholderiales bacterium]
LLMRSGVSERLNSEPSLSAPQMMYAMVSVAWAYALAGTLRAAMLCLMPVILGFGIFALKPHVARRLSYFGILMLGVEMVWLVRRDPLHFTPTQEATNWVFASGSMAMFHVLLARLGRIRARLTGQKVELTEALQRIRVLATHDDLTGLLNRRAAREALRRALVQAERSRQPVVVGLIDLDHFKRVNDIYGHQAGDRVLQAFARVAERELRGADRMARWGGEEFLLMLPDTSIEQAVACLDRFRHAFGAEPVEGIPPEHRLCFSAGVALCAGPQDADAAVERADRAMYSAKLAGRGRTGQPPDAAGAAAPACVATSALSWQAPPAQPEPDLTLPGGLAGNPPPTLQEAVG